MGNRVVKFRGKRIGNGEWVVGNLIQMGNDSSQCFIFPFYNYASSLSCRQIVAMDMVAVIPETIGQYTGLKDKNGVEIFEGDVLFIKGEDNKGTIVWDSEELEYGIDMEDVQVKLGCFYGRDLEVIGNIHDQEEAANENT